MDERPDFTHELQAAAKKRGKQSVKPKAHSNRQIIDFRKLLPGISDSALASPYPKKAEELKRHLNFEMTEATAHSKQVSKFDKSFSKGRKPYQASMSYRKPYASTSKMEPTFAATLSVETNRTAINEKISQQLRDLEQKRKEMTILPPINTYLPDIEENEFKELEQRAKKIYERKFSEYKLVYTRAARKVVATEHLRNIELDESLLKSQYEEARHRNLVSKPIPMKRSLKSFTHDVNQDTIVFNQVKSLVENKGSIVDFLTGIDNLKFSQIPEICSIR